MGHADSFQTQSALRAMLEAAGRRPDRRLGQNFLIDRNLMMKLVEAAEIGERDVCLEVGAGMGSLTGLLADRAGAVVAVEIDPHLAEVATANLGELGNVTLLNLDALSRKSLVEPEVIEAVRRKAKETGGAIKLVANLPYDIATSLVVNLLVGELPIERFCFTVQKEVAERFMARAGSREYGPVSVVCSVFTTAHRICQAPAQAFWPRPKVSSTMLLLQRRPRSEISIHEPTDFARFVRGFFLHRRKTLGHIARTLPESDKIAAALCEIPIEPRHRPEDLSPDEWVRLYNQSR